MNCGDCGNAVSQASAWHEVIGFEKDRKGGGTNHVAERKRTGRVICEGCMVRRKAGIGRAQGSLI